MSLSKKRAQYCGTEFGLGKGGVGGLFDLGNPVVRGFQLSQIYDLKGGSKNNCPIHQR